MSPPWNFVVTARTLVDSAFPGRNDDDSFFSTDSSLPANGAMTIATTSHTASTTHLPRRPVVNAKNLLTHTPFGRTGTEGQSSRRPRPHRAGGALETATHRSRTAAARPSSIDAAAAPSPSARSPAFPRRPAPRPRSAARCRARRPVPRPGRRARPPRSPPRRRPPGPRDAPAATPGGRVERVLAQLPAAGFIHRRWPGRGELVDAVPATDDERARPSRGQHARDDRQHARSATPTTCPAGRAGFVSGPRKLNTVGMPISRRGTAAWAIAGWNTGANMNAIPHSRRHRATPSG